MSNITLISEPKVNTAVRQIQQLGISPPDAAIRKIVASVYHDAYANGQRAARLDKVKADSPFPLKRN